MTTSIMDNFYILKGENNMRDKIQESLDKVIEQEINEVSSLATGSKEKTAAVNDLTELYKLRIEEAKIEQAKVDKRYDVESKQAQLNSQAMDRWVNIALQVGLTLSGLIAYNVWFKRGLRFEETGTITSPMTRNLLSRMLPKK